MKNKFQWTLMVVLMASPLWADRNINVFHGQLGQNFESIAVKNTFAKQSFMPVFIGAAAQSKPEDVLTLKEYKAAEAKAAAWGAGGALAGIAAGVVSGIRIKRSMGPGGDLTVGWNYIAGGCGGLVIAIGGAMFLGLFAFAGAKSYYVNKAIREKQ